jgi:hypothetical protein
MSEQDSTAVAVARAHIDAWGSHDYEAARAALASDVRVVVDSVDAGAPRVATTGVDDYMTGLIEFGHAVLPGTTVVQSATGDETRALVTVTSRVRFGPDAPEMTLTGARLYLVGDDRKINQEMVLFFVATS